MEKVLTSAAGPAPGPGGAAPAPPDTARVSTASRERVPTRARIVRDITAPSGEGDGEGPGLFSGMGRGVASAERNGPLPGAHAITSNVLHWPSFRPDLGYGRGSGWA